MKFFLSYFVVFSVIASLVLLASCAKDKAAEPSGTIDTVGCITPGDTVTYTNNMKRIMETYCTDKDYGTCHQSEADGGSPGLDYTNYLGIKEKADDGRLIFRVFNDPDNPMPSIKSTPPQTVTDCDLLKIQTWVDQGAPE